MWWAQFEGENASNCQPLSGTTRSELKKSLSPLIRRKIGTASFLLYKNEYRNLYLIIATDQRRAPYLGKVFWKG